MDSGVRFREPGGTIEVGRLGEMERRTGASYRSKRRAKWASHLTAIKRRDSRAEWMRGWSEVEDALPGEWVPRDSERKEKKRRKGRGGLLGCWWAASGRTRAERIDGPSPVGSGGRLSPFFLNKTFSFTKRQTTTTFKQKHQMK